MHAPVTTTAPGRIHLDDEPRGRLRQDYRHLHRHPELSMQEHHTAEYLTRALEAAGLETFRCGGTGVVGVLRNGEGPTVAFRADTDGLPIEEETGLPYASGARGTLPDGTEVPVMHGCGHDVHTACLLGAVRHLVAQQDGWSGTLLVLFQPGEETAAGARAMVEDGLWERAPRPDVILGQHVMPIPAGEIRHITGNAMALADSWRVTLRGRQSHGSQPQDAIDPVVLGAHIVTRLQTVVSRELDARRSAVVTVGTFHAGLKENIIPEQAEITLNIRSLDEQTRRRVLTAVRRVILAEAEASAAPAPVIEELYTFPLLTNDPDWTASIVEALGAELGPDQVMESEPLMGSEDFGTLPASAGVPGVYWYFGGHDAQTLAGEHVPMNHSPHFAPEEETTLETGVRAAVAALCRAFRAG
ncbi:amidohydrolase [Nesterenkonia sp. PF2B19]|uniref:amidohydrolase n=1 Tax=Nesterenkonia sp. K-15-9-6 TaxID=3093918 RepID=UPI0009F5E00B